MTARDALFVHCEVGVYYVLLLRRAGYRLAPWQLIHAA